MTATVAEQATNFRTTFFNLIFGKGEGIVCIARRRYGDSVFEESYFRYPAELNNILENIGRFYTTHDMWYCPQLLNKPKRAKENILSCPSAWADLDECDPASCLVTPTISIRSSPSRYQALWVFDQPVAPSEGEDVSRRIAYYHADDGADKSGWDLTQLLRVPLTLNFKYGDNPPLIAINKVNSADPYVTLEDFEKYPKVSQFVYTEIPFPKEIPIADEVLMKYRHTLHPYAWDLYHREPENDWSGSLWNLQMLLLESGLDPVETFAVASNAACNKYERDGRSEQMLWKETCRAYVNVEERNNTIRPQLLNENPLLTDEERTEVETTPGIIEDYIQWACRATDAAWQFHQAGIFIILSSLLCGSIDLPTSFGKIAPNLWFMVLADTTLSRKTTSMDMAMDILFEIDPDAVLATDSSIEGMMTGLAGRPGRPSIFLRDEFSGFLEAITKKDYYAGMEETLAKLYDGKFQKRMLKREIITVNEPRLIIFAGGIRDRVYNQLSQSHIDSGFIPRFIFSIAESDVTKLKPVGPPTEESTGERELLILRLTEIYKYYDGEQAIHLNGKLVTTKKVFHANLTDDAWTRYNQMEAQMLATADRALSADVLRPSFDRLCKSGLKAALLIAATRMEDPITVTEKDLVRAFYYVEQWAQYDMEVLRNFGKTQFERQVDKAYAIAKKNPGITRSEIMRTMKLSAREADMLFATLDQRAMITRVKSGRTEKIEVREI